MLVRAAAVALCLSCAPTMKVIHWPAQFDRSDSLAVNFPVVQNDKTSYIDKAGRLASTTQFRWGLPYREGLAAVLTDTLWGYVDSQGRMVIAPQFGFAGSFHDGRALVAIGGRWVSGHPRQQMHVGGRFGFIDRTGRMVIPAQYDGLTQHFSEGLAAVRAESRFGYIDTTGRPVIHATNNDAKPFSEGRAAVRRGQLWGYIGSDGTEVISPQYDSAGQFCGGRALVSVYRKVGLPFGPAVLQAQTQVIRRNGTQIPRVSRWMRTAGDLREGVAPVAKFQFLGLRFLYGYADSTGEFVIPAQFDEAQPFVEGLARVKQDNKWGFIDHSGKFVIEPIFELAEDFAGGLAMVSAGESWGYVDRTGRQVWPKSK